eukprot:6829788-Prymnesium_polylepis.1
MLLDVTHASVRLAAAPQRFAEAEHQPMPPTAPCTGCLRGTRREARHLRGLAPALPSDAAELTPRGCPPRAAARSPEGTAHRQYREHDGGDDQLLDVVRLDLDVDPLGLALLLEARNVDPDHGRVRLSLLWGLHTTGRPRLRC